MTVPATVVATPNLPTTKTPPASTERSTNCKMCSALGKPCPLFDPPAPTVSPPNSDWSDVEED